LLAEPNTERGPITSKLVPTISADGDALLRRISRQIDDRLLEQIARMDYGMEFQNNLAELQLIRDHGLIKKPLPWPPREVLNLTRWSEPASGTRSGRVGDIGGMAGHWARAFCCAALLRAYGDAETRAYEDGYNQTLVQLLDSLPHLCMDLISETMSLLAWLLLRYDDTTSERVFVGVALLHLAFKSNMKMDDADVLRFADWLVAEEVRILRARGGGVGKLPEHWLLRTTFFTLKCEKWAALGRELARAGVEHTGSGATPATAIGLGIAAAHAIGNRLAGEAEMAMPAVPL
jgi:hypothetical protein